MTTLDNLLYRNNKITYIKADLEGYEMKMLRGALHIIKDYHPKIAITCYHQKNDYKEITSFIKRLVPKYSYYLKGIEHTAGKPLMLHFWVPDKKTVSIREIKRIHFE